MIYIFGCFADNLFQYGAFLPKKFVKIRHDDFLQNHGKIVRLNAARKQLKLPPLPPKINIAAAVWLLEKYGTGITLCPKCKQGKLELIAIVYPNIFKSITVKAITGSLRNKASP